MACECNSGGGEEERKTSLPAVEAMEPVWVSIVCVYLDAESLSLWMLDLQDWMDLLQRGPMSKQN